MFIPLFALPSFIDRCIQDALVQPLQQTGLDNVWYNLVYIYIYIQWHLLQPHEAVSSHTLTGYEPRESKAHFAIFPRADTIRGFRASTRWSNQ